MKKFLLLIIAGGFVYFLIFAGLFIYNNFRGIGPAVLPSAENDDVILENRIKQDLEKNLPEGNNTGLPLTMPSGFSMSLFAKALGGPRVLQFDPNGILLVSLPSQGKVVALPSSEEKEKADDPPLLVVEGLNKPHGIAFHPITKKLYIAETDQVAVYDYDEVSLKATNKKKIIDLPGGGNHFTRTIGFGPGGRLYISVGSSCNVCVEKDERRAAILVADVIGPGPVTPKVYASGLRNSVFFTWHPVTRDLWATEMGRDFIGDDIPPDEINIIKEGADFGWPYCYGKNVHDTTFDSSLRAKEKCLQSRPSHIDLQAHSAPLGLAFIPNSWPEEYQGDLLVAYHGSWNRSTPTGYKVVRIKVDEKGNYEGVEDFITGWLDNVSSAEGALGRPVDVLFDKQGNLYISDDKAGVIYRVSPQSSK